MWRTELHINLYLALEFSLVFADISVKTCKMEGQGRIHKSNHHLSLLPGQAHALPPMPCRVEASDGEFCLHYCGEEERCSSPDEVVRPFNTDNVYSA